MNEPRETSDLDRALHGWAERREAAKDHDGLLGRIMTAHGRGGGALPPVSLHAPRLRPHRTAWFAMGAAAAALVAATLLVVLRPRPDVVVPSDLPPQYAWLDQSQLGEKAALLREMERVFENRLQWVAETEGRVVMQVEQDGRDGAALPAEAAGVAVRVVVVQRDADSDQWTPVWAVDVLARQQQVVHLTPSNAGLPPGTELVLWAFAVDDDVIAVDSRLSVAEHSLQVEFSDVQRSGVPARVYEVREHGRQYRVFQTIAMLDDKV
ncbi:MAG TPA: hypothetical protein VMY42_08870 [Thermoguttaceae bacterium]|nr:hypothetical protein [Thermoguttaceae bacterium]